MPTNNPSSHVRFWIIGVLFLVTAINYASRSALSIANAPLSNELGISLVNMGFIFSAFSGAYVLGQLPGGALLDRFGSRPVYIWSILLWSLFTAAQAFVGGINLVSVVTSLFVLRLLLGVAEAPAFPANARIVASWFPDSERGTASAIFNSAQYFSLVFIPVLGWLIQDYGWRTSFLAMGCVGVAGAGIFALTVFPPTRHSRVSQSEFDNIERNGALVHMDQTAIKARVATPIRWGVIGELLSRRMLLAIYLGQYCVNALTYFFATWFPTYLINARHLSIMQASFATLGPGMCGFIGGVLGGVVSDMLLRRGFSLSAARKIPIAVGFIISGAIVLCNFTDSSLFAIVFMSIGFFGKGIGALGWAVLSDVAPREAAGLSGSLFNMFGNAAGIVTPIVIAYIVKTTGSWDTALVFLVAHSVVALLAFTILAGPIERVVLKPST